jgi:hypothetical protein
MNYKISCSFGEIIDKYCILKIKKNKTDDKNKLYNINNEINIIKKEYPIVTNEENLLFLELYKINSRLWILEDLIRYKSSIKEFDKQYIKCAESIHIENDKRAAIKKKINVQFNSLIVEEKIYNNNPNLSTEPTQPTQQDIIEMEKGKKMYSIANYTESMDILQKLILKFENYKKYDNFFVDLLFSYETICGIYNKKTPYFQTIKNIMNILSELDLYDELKNYCKHQFLYIALKKLLYEKAYPYLNTFNNITGPNVNKDNMSFFKKDDNDKILLIYEGGGIGDIIMFSRMIPELCKQYSNNKIYFLIPNKLLWIYQDIFKNLNNLKLFTHEKVNLMGYFDYHCNLPMLLKHLSYTYENITFEPLLTNLTLPLPISNYTNQILKNIKESDKKSYIFNWKGNSKNNHEKYNRGMTLENAIPLFKMNINWIIITIDLSDYEKKILSDYDIKYYGDKIDKEYSFSDTMILCKNVEAVFSTDTSILHIAANLDIPTYALLTLGCEWRWTTGNNTNWYPKVKFLKQKEQGKWDTVIEKIISIIS